jgi:YidC/Oxa1 family membrane protein insertase
MKKNVFLAMMLSMAVLIGWDALMRPRQPAPTKAAPAAPPASVPIAGAPAPASAAPVDRDRRVEYTIGDNRVAFNPQGASVRQWWIQEKFGWVPLVPEAALQEPFSTFPDVLFEVERRGSGDIVFTGKTAAGLEIRKTYRISPDSHMHRVSLSVTNASGETRPAAASLGWGPALASGDPADKEKAGDGRALIYDPPRLMKMKAAAVEGAFRWWATDARYFLVAFLNDPDEKVRLTVEKKAKKRFAVSETLTATLGPGQALEEQRRFYLGPKGYAQLAGLGLGLERTVDFGLFGSIGKMILKSLYALQKLTGNYGWAIVLLTVLIQVLVLPLTLKSFRHSQRMKALQPQLKRIQELYKSDPKRQQAEMLHIYRRHGMKFMGMEGCLPVLVQMPVFFALYTTLNNSYELRGAPWIVWIQDLSVHDPYYALPILWGILMFVQQKISLTTMDPAQAQMMMFMPIIMTFLFLKLPAGLVLYWCTSTLISLGLQVAFLKSQPEPAAVS